MTTVRHETVHYTVEEMAAREAAEKIIKAKKRRTMLIICGVVLLLVGIICCGCPFIGSRLPDAPKATRTPPTEWTPAPTATSFPTLAYLTIAQIEQERGVLTDLQKERYDQSILGNVVKFHGQVIEVHEDGRVQIDDGGLFVVVILLGIPKDEAIALSKGHLIEGMGTIAECSTFLGVHIEIQVTSWNN